MNASQPLATESPVGVHHLLALSRATRAVAEAACLRARTQVDAARAARAFAAAQRARARGARACRRRVVVYLPDAVELARVCRQLADLHCEIVATTDLARAAAEIEGRRRIDLLITQETLAVLAKPHLLH